jgi:hypothetical protein
VRVGTGIVGNATAVAPASEHAPEYADPYGQGMPSKTWSA